MPFKIAHVQHLSRLPIFHSMTFFANEWEQPVESAANDNICIDFICGILFPKLIHNDFFGLL